MSIAIAIFMKQCDLDVLRVKMGYVIIDPV